MYLVNEDKKTLSSGEDFFTDSMKYKKIGALWCLNLWTVQLVQLNIDINNQLSVLPTNFVITFVIKRVQPNSCS